MISHKVGTSNLWEKKAASGLRTSSTVFYRDGTTWPLYDDLTKQGSIIHNHRNLLRDFYATDSSDTPAKTECYFHLLIGPTSFSIWITFVDIFVRPVSTKSHNNGTQCDMKRTKETNKTNTNNCRQCKQRTVTQAIKDLQWLAVNRKPARWFLASEHVQGVRLTLE